MNNDTNFDCLFTPFSIGKMEIKNRLVMSPMGTYAALMDGSVSDTLATYFEERAKGGVGAIITASQYLTPKLAQGIYGTYFDSKRIIPHLSGMTERIHCYGAKAIAQISAGTGRNAHPSQCGGVPFSASAVPAVFNPDILCRPLTIEEIKDIMKSWQLAAEIAANAGYDAIEVHGHVGYIIDQFLTPLWNKREDEYGGSDENRARFAIEILEAIKRGAGDDMPVIYRISMDHRIPGGRTLEDSKRLIKILGEHGVDAFDVDCGCYEHPDFVYPTFYRGDACMEYVCDTAREATDKPILNSGNHTPETAKRLIESGRADFVMMGRPLIADPELPRKLMENREEDVRPCIRCNEECIGRIWGRFAKLSCAVNPQANEEHAFRIVKSEEPKNVVVIGGGPGGMEAARVAALKGHHVTLYERDELGDEAAERGGEEHHGPHDELNGAHEDAHQRHGAGLADLLHGQAHHQAVEDGGAHVLDAEQLRAQAHDGHGHRAAQHHKRRHDGQEHDVLDRDLVKGHPRHKMFDRFRHAVSCLVIIHKPSPPCFSLKHVKI